MSFIGVNTWDHTKYLMLRSYILSSALLEVTGFWVEKDLEEVDGRSLDLVGGGTTKQCKCP